MTLHFFFKYGLNRQFVFIYSFNYFPIKGNWNFPERLKHKMSPFENCGFILVINGPLLFLLLLWTFKICLLWLLKTYLFNKFEQLILIHFWAQLLNIGDEWSCRLKWKENINQSLSSHSSIIAGRCKLMKPSSVLMEILISATIM